MPIYLFWSPPPPPPFLPSRPERANKFAYSSLVPFHSAAAWKEQPGMRALRHDWLLCFFICKLESRGVFFSVFSLRLVISSLSTSVYLFFSKRGTLGSLVQKFFHLCFEIDLNRWCMSLCVFLTAFHCWTLTLPSSPPSPSPASATRTYSKNSLKVSLQTCFRSM